MKLPDKMCKYEMDPANIMEVTEWTRFCPQMVIIIRNIGKIYFLELQSSPMCQDVSFGALNGRTDRQGETSIPPFNFVEQGVWLTLEQQYFSILHSQYHAYWRTGDFTSQCISRHSIDAQTWNILSLASGEGLVY